MALDVRVDLSDEDVAAHHRVRHEVFVREQGIFTGDDRDGWDDGAVKVVARAGARVLGAVRLYPLDEAGLWTAGAHGGTRMIALIQARNVAFFRHLGWSALGDETDYRGATHQEMTIALAGAQPEFAPGGYAWALGAA